MRLPQGARRRPAADAAGLTAASRVGSGPDQPLPVDML
jgi:hypothetical protein